ncbi:MAG: peptide MFS transporter [Odoribacteraceae bacterium]|jgi:POT family proton-dependent oligopeptide transporter|nr:peptide MFS transporter [Odoribacteraceae bacterium]
MFKKHPKGLLAASLSNMGERFGFYIMMAVLSLFISSKFGLNEKSTGLVYSIFYASIYVLALVGGLIADKTRNYRGTILAGILVMALGYLIIAIPTPTPVPHKALYLTLTCFGLLTIAFGNGLFKGNLQALVGLMYDRNKAKYEEYRDPGFLIFYMFINVGAIFAPLIAVGLRNWWLIKNNFGYNANLPELCHEFLGKGAGMKPEQLAKLNEYANEAVLQGTPGDLATFCNEYLDVFNRGFQYAFMAAIGAMCISLVIYLFNKKKFPDHAKEKKMDKTTHVASTEVKMAADEIRRRIWALFAVFGIVIFFWFSFHQNGYSLTYFARDYIDLNVIDIDLWITRLKGAELFQSVNPFFVVFLTPLVMWIFGRMRAKKKEPSTPKKIGIGMGIATLGFLFLLACSAALPDQSALKDMSKSALDTMRLTPLVMVGMYFILTVAELFISPLGLSFVSKVAPPHLKGTMQGCWLAATAAGNGLIFIGGWLYTSVPLWACWLVFAVACAISMIVMLSMVKWLERIAK